LPKKQKPVPRPAGILSVLWKGLLVFLVLLIGLECIARLPAVRSRIPLRSFGFSDYLFEIKWQKLKSYTDENGAPDVIILGNSMVNTGIDPLVINSRLNELSGKSLTIFNFGVEGLNLASVPQVAKIILENYHPKVLIIGTDIRDYSLRMDQEPTLEFLKTDWLRYKAGSFTLNGWLIDHSVLLQDFLLARNWYQPDFHDQFMTVYKRFKDVNAAGYELDRHLPDTAYQAPDPANPSDKTLFDQFRNYTYDAGRLAILVQLVELGRQYDTSVIFLEMPLQKTMYQFFDQPDQTRVEFLGLIQPIIQKAGGNLIETPIYTDIPDADWGNRTHLNLNGAPIFSKYLAEQLVKVPEIQVLMK